MYVLTYAIGLGLTSTRNFFFSPPTGWIQNQGLGDGSEACWPQGLQQEADHEHKETGQPEPVEMHDLCHVSRIQFFFSSFFLSVCTASRLTALSA